MPETRRRGDPIRLYDTAVDPDFDAVDAATEEAVDWVSRGHAFEAIDGLGATQPKGER